MKYFSNNDNINNLIDGAMDKIKTIVDTSTVVGEQVETPDGTIIIPISRVSVGYVVGGGEYADLSSRRVANHYPMAGGSSGGMSMTPVGFLVIMKEEVKFVNVENKSLYQTVLNMFNALLEKVEGKEGDKSEKE
ncbi:MAG: sporulation protein YtfJ [Clostridia bacterium]|nr:sporulation protein YtfJ [Clostridia bacterium]